MKIIVTGGSGFIGSNFIDYWMRTHAEDLIVNVDKMTYASDSWYNRNVRRNKNYTFVKADISNLKALGKIVEDADTVINFAAETHVDRSIERADTFLKTNVSGVYNILELARKRGFRFHQVSTDEVYGSLPRNSDEKFNVETCYNPRNPYSATKASADFLVKSYCNTYGVNATISNCSNNYGPNQHPEKLIPKTIIYGLLKRKIPIYGNGEQSRDWIYVEDHCSALESILYKGNKGRTYLISSQCEVRNIDLVTKILGLMGIDEKLIQFVNDRPGHDERYSIDASPFMKELGWKSTFSLNDGLRKTIDHYRSNIDRYTKKL